VFAKGCAGMFVFAWTDEWWRGGSNIEDWDFGLVDRQRNPKAALFAVSMAMDNIPFSSETQLPHITVIVCSYNGSATIRECIEGILKMEYPDFDVIVVNDGSTDNLIDIVSQYPVKLISTSNYGLSSARNTGMYNAKGEIIAYIDDDAYPDPHWLSYLAYAYLNSDHACIGGPNIAPYDDPFISTCVANAPGGPVHVLQTDEIAEHVPGCNMSFRKDALMKIGGFDSIFRAAGDDVDVCWRMQQSGSTIGFHPSAVVWHHRRNSFKAYWKQQKGYGKAEALLEAKWPEKYNGLGHLTWAGRIYGNGFTLPVKIKKDKIFHGTWGSALFQSVYQPAGNFINSIPLMPEWYLLSASLAILGSLGFLWHPLLWVWPAFAVSIAIVIIQAVLSAKKNSSLRSEQKNYKYTLFIILLHMIQPVARLYGRFSNGLTPWRKRGATANTKFLFRFSSQEFKLWSEEWRSAQDWLAIIERNLMNLKARVKRGSDFAKWDIQVKNGLFIRSTGLLTIEEHGAAKQFIRIKCTPHYSIKAFIIPAVMAVVAVFAVAAQQYVVAVIVISFVLLIALQFLLETARSMNSLYTAFKMLGDKEPAEKLKLVVRENNEPATISLTNHFINNLQNADENFPEVEIDINQNNSNSD
jgi:glycosyltransferase involved in cell wall biosynthesis